jgi:hypothetical protein
MALFGTDGDAVSGIATPTPGTPASPGTITVNQDTMILTGGVAPAAGTPTHASVRFAPALADPMNCYVAVYKGGTDLGSGNWSPVGATLIGVTANITDNTSAGSAFWKQDMALSSAAAFALGDRLWIAILARNGFRNEAVFTDGTDATKRGDWSQKTGSGSFDYGWQFTSVTGTTTPPSTAPSGGAVLTSGSPLVAYITYSTGASSSLLKLPGLRSMTGGMIDLS